MKKTLLLAMPRTGSLALSIIMNTKECLSHHEHHDYVSYRRGITFPETQAYQLYLQAKKEGKNYACFDTGIIPLCLLSIMKNPDTRKQFLESDWQVLIVERNPNDIGKSLINVLHDDPTIEQIIKTMEVTKTLHSKLEDLICDVLDLLHKHDDRVKIILKDGRHFTEDQLTEIAEFVGSGEENIKPLGRANISLSGKQLLEGASIIRKSYFTEELTSKN